MLPVFTTKGNPAWKKLTKQTILLYSPGEFQNKPKPESSRPSTLLKKGSPEHPVILGTKDILEKIEIKKQVNKGAKT